MKTKFYAKWSFVMIVFGLLTTNLFGQPVPSLTGPIDPATNLPATLGGGVTTGQIYSTDPGQTGYKWNVSSAGQITAGDGTYQITVTWTNPTGQQTVSVSYDGSATAVLIINYYPFLPETDPTKIPQFVDPLPHFAGGLRIDAKAGGNLTIKAELTKQVAVSTGTVLANGVVGTDAGAGVGNYAGYAISKDGVNFGPTMWPAQTIETYVGKELKVQYLNKLDGVKYSDFNILVDQTLLLNGYPLNGDPLIDPYAGPIPMVVHLHGGEMPSNSDGGPTAWFMPNNGPVGPGFKYNASTLATYPNMQESGTLWYHPHDQGNTRTNVYTGLAGFYFLRGPDEEAAHLPGWSGDDLVQEVAPAGATGPFYPTTPYLPEIEIAIQDRMFNVNGELYWPVNPTNPDIHPFWTPEFFGDVMTVNGKTWPYLSVAQRKYRFRMLDGCNARFLNMWLKDLASGTTAPVINVIGSDGQFMDSPKVLDAAGGNTLFMAPGERYDIVIDFSNVPAGTVFTLMNDAPAPYPTGDPVVTGLTDRIMQFVVNGKLVSASDPTKSGHDNSALPGTIRLNPMVKLTDFAGKWAAGVTPSTKREIILNEVTGAGGPVQVLFNNSHFDGVSPIPGAPPDFGGPTEIPLEGTTEQIAIINTTVDAHPIHVHLTQWQLVGRQQYDTAGFMTAYRKAWAARNIPEWPAGLGYPGGSGSPMDYNSTNGDGAIGGNPAVNDFLIPGTFTPARPEEQIWKDDVKAFPGEVATFMVRFAPTDRPINATPQQLLYPFDPSLGPGYVWHCHIIDHEDMDMMRPLMIRPSELRFPQITAQPVAVIACVGDIATYTVNATSATKIDYQWQISTDAGATWTDLKNGSPYTGVTSPSMHIVAAADLSTNQYRCNLTNIDGTTTSDAVLLTVNACSISGTLKYNNVNLDPLSGFSVNVNGLTAVTDGGGAFKIDNVTSGTFAVTVASILPAGSINSTDAGDLNSWVRVPITIPNVTWLSGDVNNDQSLNSSDVQSIQQDFVTGKPFAKDPWVYWNTTGSGKVSPPPFNVVVNGESVTGFDIFGMCTGDFNGSFLTSSGVSLDFSASGYTSTYPAGKQFDLPIVAGSSMQVGAVSLILSVPSKYVTVKNVTVPGSADAVTYNVKGDELRIGWNSTTPVDVPGNGNLLVISLMPTTSFTSSFTLNVGLVSNSLNELADGLYNPFSASLKVDAVKINAIGKSTILGLSASPNPMKGSTKVTYSLPVDGTMKMELFNSMGGLSQTVITSMFQTAGTYTKDLYITTPKGSYLLTLTLQTATGEVMTKTITIVKK